MIEQPIRQYLLRHRFAALKPTAVFFDMDGVLFDSMPNHAIAWEQAMSEQGLPFTKHDAYMSEGQPGADTVNHVFSQVHGREATTEERKRIYDLKGTYFSRLGEIKPMPYAYDMLKKLQAQGYRLFVVTGSGHTHLLNSIQHAFPGIFEQERIISAFDVKRGKPHPDPYLKALERAEAKPWEALVVENAPFGVQAAAAAKIFTVGINTGPLDKAILAQYGAHVVLDGMQHLYETWDLFPFNPETPE